MASSFSSFSYRRQFNTHNTANQQFGTRGDFRWPSSPSIVKRQCVFAAFASLYGCVLVITSAAKLLEDQEPEARIHGCMTLTGILVLICFPKVLMFNMHEIWSFDSQKIIKIVATRCQILS